MICPSIDVATVKMGTLIKEMLPRIGVDVDLVVLEYDTFVSIIWNPPADGYEMAIRYVEPSPPPY